MLRVSHLLPVGLYASIIGLSAGATALAWPHIAQVSQNRSAFLTNARAVAEPAQEAALRLKLATWLDPNNQVATLSLAKIQLELGRTPEAVALLDKVRDLPEASILLMRIQIEEGNYGSAAAYGSQSMASAPTSEIITLTILSHCLAGKSAELSKYAASFTSEGIQRTLGRAQAGHVLLGDELRSAMLPNAAIRVLSGEPVSYTRNLALAKVLNSRRQAGDLLTSASLLEAAVAIDPSRLDGRRLLINIYNDLGKTEQATDQEILAHQIEAGRP